MTLVPVDDAVRLRTWTSGSPSDLPPVVLVHGGPGLWDYVGPVTMTLAPGGWRRHGRCRGDFDRADGHDTPQVTPDPAR